VVWCEPHHNHTTLTLNGCGVVVVLVWCGVVWLWCGCGVDVVWLAPQPHHTNFKRLWCWCGVVVVLVWCGCGVVVMWVWCELVWVNVVTCEPPYKSMSSNSVREFVRSRNNLHGSSWFKTLTYDAAIQNLSSLTSLISSTKLDAVVHPHLIRV